MAPFSMILIDSLTQISRSRHHLTPNISENVQDTDCYSRILTHVRPTQGCHFEWPWVTLSDLAKYSMTQSIMQSLHDRWAPCLARHTRHHFVNFPTSDFHQIWPQQFSVYGYLSPKTSKSKESNRDLTLHNRYARFQHTTKTFDVIHNKKKTKTYSLQRVEVVITRVIRITRVAVIIAYSYT